MRSARLLCVLFLALSFTSFATAQNPGTGLYAFGSFDSRGFDSINIGNLNTHFEIPIVSKPGRGMNFNYSIVYDGLIWSAQTISGTQTWVPDPGYGFHEELLGNGLIGYVSYTETQISSCPPIPPNKPGFGTTETYFYHDATGRVHPFNYTVTACVDHGSTVTGNGATSDGSGYSFDGVKVHTRNGALINAPINPVSQANSGSITDSNGNTITNNGNSVFTDTLGVPELTIGGSGNASSPLTLSYPIAKQGDGATAGTAAIYYKTYTVQTNFQCGITESGAKSTDLVDHIQLANGDTYSFTYEPTPGFGGSVTGRLASITLPTGGVISYSYQFGCANGINADGSVGQLTRTTTDGQRVYGRSAFNGGTSTALTDEAGNLTVYNFSSTNGLFYETQHQACQGPSASGADLLSSYTCYNGTSLPCDGGAITLPITETDNLTSYNNDAQLETKQYFASATGVLTQNVLSETSVLSTTSMAYNGYAEVTSSVTTDGSGNTLSSATYGYDETAPMGTSGIPQHTTGVSGGNQTSSHTQTGSGTIDTTTAYYDTGMPVSTTNTNSNSTTSLSYDPTQTFVTTTTLPTPSSGVQLATSAIYDPSSGEQLSATGMNSGQTVTYTQYDSLFRPTIVTLPNGSQINYTYTTPNQTIMAQAMGNGQTAESVTDLDRYGRTIRTAVYNGQSSNSWYIVDSCYSPVGLLSFQSVKYQGDAQNGGLQCSGNGTSYAYDALGRVTTTTNSDGTATRQYQGRAVKSTSVNGVQKITQYDVLGRVASVCEISANNQAGGDSPTDCQSELSGSGYLTTYAYNPAGSPNLTTVTQGAQIRTFQTDLAGRTIKVIEPERGETDYSYDTTGLVVTRTRPTANQTGSTRTTTTTQNDVLGRVISVTYSDGTPTKSFWYDQATAFGANPGVSLGSSKGMLTLHSVNFSGSGAATAYGYDVMGNVNWMDQCQPSGCGNSVYDKFFTYSYDNLGNMLNASDLRANNNSGVTTSYSYSSASELTSLQSSLSGPAYPTSIVSNVQNGPTGPLSYQFGNGLSQSDTYDSLGRLNGGWVCDNSPVVACPAQQFGFVAAWKGSQVTFAADDAMGQISLGYDDFNRLISAAYSNTQTFSYTYDRYGNRWSQSGSQGGGPAPTYTFNLANNHINGPPYDAAGNLMSDGPTSNGRHSYTYDAEGNLTYVDGGATATYYYNALNQRIRADQGGTSREYVFNLSGQRVAIWDGNTRTQVQGQYYWGRMPVAFYSGGSLHFQHQDWMGTERVRTSYNGSQEGVFQSLAFGDGFAASGLDSDPYHFAQLDQDSESGTSHAQFRQYSNLTGQWMSPDPYDGSYHFGNPQSFNRYSYVMNRPMSGVDPSGMECEGLGDEECSGGGIDDSSDPPTYSPCDLGPINGSCSEGVGIFAE